ncbi:MAG: hypothetical protein KJP26_00625 [Maribacter sp.]|nr:hypothetical protein [Maribacter sp.]NNK18600.1 hypothetical protein [Maribacter sp.]
MKQYSSFTEIDYRLKILSLQREIDKESLKLNLKRLKFDLYPSNFMVGFKEIVQRSLISLIATKLLKRHG